MSDPAAWGDPPWIAFHERLLDHVAGLETRGRTADAAALAVLVESWWGEQEGWRARLFELLRMHHDLNNALVGVRGNAQLLMMGPAAPLPGVRERLEVLLRETSRIQEAVGRLRELKSTLGGVAPLDRAA